MNQEESVSIGKNQVQSYRRRMERGEFITCYAPFGCRLADGKNLEIVEEQAEIVRWIFEQYLAGQNSDEIAAELTRRGIKSVSGKDYWNEKTIRKMLQNEKYIGDSLCQKTFTTSVFPFTRQYNHGNVIQYYIENTHPPIIAKEDFEKVQELRQRRGRPGSSWKAEYSLSLKMICGSCGSPLTRRVTKNGHISWVCRKHDDHSADCPIGRIPENEIYAAFVRMYNKLKLNEGIVLKPVLAQLDDLNAALQRGNPAMLEVNKAIADTAEQNYKITALQAKGVLDADACTTRLQAIYAKLTELRRERRQLLQNENLEDVMEALRQTADTVHTDSDRLDSFDEDLFAGLVEKITVESQTSIRFRLRGGLDLTEWLREVSR